MIGPAWDNDPRLRAKSDSVRTARHRRYQSWYRETHLGVLPDFEGGSGAGSRLPRSAVADNPRLNFISDEALVHAAKRIAEVRKEKGALNPDRLTRNMLSSMPMCFNIFGSLGTKVLPLIQKFVDPDAASIVDVICEWAPQPPSAYLGDKTAFDALVVYRTADDKQRFVGVETKYTEPFSQFAYLEGKSLYTTVTNDCGWFKPDSIEALSHRSTNQLWRNTMLAAALAQQGDERLGRFDGGSVLVLTLPDDDTAAKCVAAIYDRMIDQTRVRHVTLEELTEHATTIAGLAAWAEAFTLRYLGPEPT